ncbi:MAG: DUF4192 domain-containing protein [Jatrophihabitantaceae bacterium]
MTRIHESAPRIRIGSPAEIIDAIPYLLGFHPHESMVLVGLRDHRLVVTARVDLADLAAVPVLVNTLEALARGGASEFVAVIYDDRTVAGSSTHLPWTGLYVELGETAEALGCQLDDGLLVSKGRWWSYRCHDILCCPEGGTAIDAGASPISAEATYAGLCALPNRAALEASLDPLPDAERSALDPMIAAAESAAHAAVLGSRAEREQRAVKREIFAAARAVATPGVDARLTDAEVARFVVALTGYAVRDAVWMALDDQRLDGRELWRELARRAPSPYDAAPLFLLGWCSWRSGNGALANMAADRAVASDPGYSAADLLLAALARGLDPRQFPKLRVPRSA